jgi:hypothetical protein
MEGREAFHILAVIIPGCFFAADVIPLYCRRNKLKSLLPMGFYLFFLINSMKCSRQFVIEASE